MFLNNNITAWEKKIKPRKKSVFHKNHYSNSAGIFSFLLVKIRLWQKSGSVLYYPSLITDLNSVGWESCIPWLYTFQARSSQRLSLLLRLGLLSG